MTNLMGGRHQPEGGRAILVAGEAGSGKSTLGRCIAASLGLPMLDLDSMTNPLLEALPAELLGGHWLASPNAVAIRDGRYAALRETGRDMIATVGSVVLVAPFTRELRGEEEWRTLNDALAPADVTVIHIVGAPELFAARRAARGEERDVHRRVEVPESVQATDASGAAQTSPVIPTMPIAAELSTQRQLARVMSALGCRLA